MSVAEYVDVGLDVLGGLNTSMPPANLPPGASPLNQDIVYPEGAVRTRPGLSSFFADLLANLPSINGLKTYITPTFIDRLMVWTALGSIYKESAPGVLSLISSGNISGLLYRSTSLFGREYMAFYSGNTGGDIPRQFDDTNFDRVSQVGPGAAPSVIDEVISETIAASPNGLIMTADSTIKNSPLGLIEVGNVVTVAITGTLPNLDIHVGDSIKIAGAGVAAYDGTWQIASVDGSSNTFTFVIPTSGLAASGAGTVSWPYVTVTPTPTPGFGGATGQTLKISGATDATYDGTWPVRSISGSNINGTTVLVLSFFSEMASGGGTLAYTGSIPAGTRQVTVAFVTRQGYITAYAPPNSWTAAGSLRAVVANIPIGPANVIARLLLFTTAISAPATTGPFYSIPSIMRINDNTTTTVTVDFLDTTLAAEFSGSYLAGQQELGECSFAGGYSNRTIWLGERNKVQNFINLPFEGGWNLAGGAGGSDVPLGWTSDPTSGAGGSRDTANSVWLDAFRITGDGATAKVGMITQSAYRDYLSVAILQLNTSYSYRVRLKANGLVQGNFAIEIYSAGGGGSLGLATVGYAGISTTGFTEFTGALLAAQAVIPSDVVLRVYGSGTLTNTGYITVDCIEVFPTNSPVNASNARVSYINNPESFDGVTGNIGVRANDGQVLRGGFPLRNQYYLGKDHYLAAVTDDGMNEPSSWQLQEISATVGICGPNAVDWTEEWAVTAERSGVYLQLGSDPIKIMQEIQEDASQTGKVCWNSINWNYGHTVWVRIDQLNKYIYVGAPVNGATSPNVIFMMDYKFSNTADLIAAGPGVVYSVFTGKLLSHGAARKWTIWNLTAPCACFSERPDGTAQFFLGNGVSNGKIYELLDDGHYSDDGVAINSFYDTFAMPSAEEEQALQLRAHRKLYGYLTGRVSGSAVLPGNVVTMSNGNNGITTVVMSAAHGLATGQWIIVTGALDPTYNGWFQVSVVSAKAFQYQDNTSSPSTTGASIVGTLNLTAITDQRSIVLRGINLVAAPTGDFERPVNISAERVIWKVGTSLVGSFFQLEKLIVDMMVSPVTPVRGMGQ